MIKETFDQVTGGSSLPDHIQKIVELTGVEVEHVNDSLGGRMLGRILGR
ncbi:MAG: hypothetical protein ACLFNN_01320 [Candidatus Paceibacterota bacterium]